MLEAALHYASLGYPVFPLAVRGKEPMIPKAAGGQGFKDATLDEAQIREWWTKWPKANIGINPPAGTMVLDIDAEAAVQSLAALGHIVPATANANTSRGRHHWLRTDREVAKCTPWLNVDVIQSDGYVLAPPSVHPSGVVYEWETAPTEQNIAEAPQWLYALIDAKMAGPAPGAAGSSQGGTRGAALAVLSGAPAGERDNSLFKYAARLRSLSVDREEAEILLRSAWERIEQPVGDFLTWEHALGRLESAWKFPEGKSPEFQRPATAPQTIEAAAAPGGLAIVDGRGQVREEIEILSIEELMSRSYPPVKWLVDGLISEGLTVVSAAPKIGKSWLVLGLALAVARGGAFMGCYHAVKGKVLYLDLEQPQKKTQKRLGDLLQSERGTKFPSGISFAHRWPRMGDGGLELLDRWLEDNPEARMVAIDVLAKVRTAAASKGGNAYDEDYLRYGDLKALADKRGVGIVAIHHDTKAADGDPIDKVSGSRGLVAVADAIIVLTRKRGARGGTLFATGREIEDISKPIYFDPHARSWMAGETENAPV